MSRLPTNSERNRKRIAEYIEKLHDADVKIRRKAAAKLGQLGDAAAVEPLCCALRDNNAHVRRHAAESLGLLRAPDAFGPLQAALNTNQVGLRHAAARSLARIAMSYPHLAGSAVNAIVQSAQKFPQADRSQYVLAIANIGLMGVGPLCVEYNTRRSQAAHQCIRESLSWMEQQNGLDVRRQMLAEAVIPSGQLLAVLEMLPAPPSKGWFAARQTPDARRYCERLAADPHESADVRRGAQGILDYLSLGRASQRHEPGERAVLLRMASDDNTRDDQADTLLRGSAAADIVPARPSLLARLRRWLGLPSVS